MKRNKYSLILTALFFVSAYLNINAQEVASTKLSGNLDIDSEIQAPGYTQTKISEINFNAGEKKSPLLAAIMSGILPGAGEFYSQRYLKAGILVTVEAAAIATAMIYTRKGDNQTASFENYANHNWSIAKYAAWTLQNISKIPYETNPQINPHDYNVFPNDDWTKFNSSTDWSQLNSHVNKSELNRLEGDISGGYSHELAKFGTQDYYEIIGKYPQFSHGWSTSDFNSDYNSLPHEMYLYAHARGLANSYYTTGNTAIIAIFVNHFLSIFDAIWSTDSYNNSLALNVRVQDSNAAGYYELTPSLNLSYNF